MDPEAILCFDEGKKSERKESHWQCQLGQSNAPNVSEKVISLVIHLLFVSLKNVKEGVEKSFLWLGWRT